MSLINLANANVKVNSRKSRDSASKKEMVRLALLNAEGGACPALTNLLPTLFLPFALKVAPGSSSCARLSRWVAEALSRRTSFGYKQRSACAAFTLRCSCYCSAQVYCKAWRGMHVTSVKSPRCCTLHVGSRARVLAPQVQAIPIKRGATWHILGKIKDIRRCISMPLHLRGTSSIMSRHAALSKAVIK